MEKFKSWLRELSRADIVLLVIIFIFGVWVATEEHSPVSKKEVNGIELNVVVVDNVEYKITRAYSTSKSINIELINGDVVVLTDYYITKEGIVKQIKE